MDFADKQPESTENEELTETQCFLKISRRKENETVAHSIDSKTRIHHSLCNQKRAGNYDKWNKDADPFRSDTVFWLHYCVTALRVDPECMFVAMYYLDRCNSERYKNDAHKLMALRMAAMSLSIKVVTDTSFQMKLFSSLVNHKISADFLYQTESALSNSLEELLVPTTLTFVNCLTHWDEGPISRTLKSIAIMESVSAMCNKYISKKYLPSEIARAAITKAFRVVSGCDYRSHKETSKFAKDCILDMGEIDPKNNLPSLLYDYYNQATQRAHVVNL